MTMAIYIHHLLVFILNFVESNVLKIDLLDLRVEYDACFRLEMVNFS